MIKRRLFLYLIGVLGAFFLFCGERAYAKQTVINEYPEAGDIIYGQPLFMSKLNGGSVNVDGTFLWKENNLVLDAGVHEQIVVFVPNDSAYSREEISVEVNVSKRRVYLEFSEKLQKQYDSSDRLIAPSYVVRGIVDKEVYVSGNISLKLASVFVGENIDVTISGLELKGDVKDNYYLDLSGFKASVHPKFKEFFGETKDRVDFSFETLIPVNSVLKIEKNLNENLDLKNHKIISAYEVSVVSNNSVVDIEKIVHVKIKVNEENLNVKRLKIYNYYDNEYKEIDYSYADGYLSYSCVGLGTLVIAQKDFNYIWLYIICGIILMGLSVYVGVRIAVNRRKINRYRSLKRSKDYGNY